jgi:hypothetical protein
MRFGDVALYSVVPPADVTTRRQVVPLLEVG